jgi:2,3-bisphosphoglycerate-dependent phosphoglycerate mutase
MEFYFIRHGQSTNNARNERCSEPPLTDLGVEQAKRTGEALRDLGITRLYCSPMLRTLHTATIIGELLNLAPHVFVELHEWGGVWKDLDDGEKLVLPGLKRSEMREVCANVILPGDVTDDGWCFIEWDNIDPDPSHGNKEVQVAYENALTFIAHLDRHHTETDEKVAAVSHGAFGSTFLSTLLGLPPNDDTDRFTHHNAAVSKIHQTPARTRILHQNQIGHLAKESEYILNPLNSPMVTK